MITTMPELDEMLTTRDAQKLAVERGVKMSLSYISRLARNGRISGSRRVGDWSNAPWLLPRNEFELFVDQRRGRGRPKIDD